MPEMPQKCIFGPRDKPEMCTFYQEKPEFQVKQENGMPEYRVQIMHSRHHYTVKVTYEEQ